MHLVGVYDDEGPPVPIPNTVVKLIRAENTWMETSREDRSMPTLKVKSFSEYQRSSLTSKAMTAEAVGISTFSSVGRATDSLSVGPGFESPKVHQKKDHRNSGGPFIFQKN